MPSSRGSTALVSMGMPSFPEEEITERVPHILETVSIGANKSLFHQAVAETMHIS